MKNMVLAAVVTGVTLASLIYYFTARTPTIGKLVYLQSGYPHYA